MIDGMDRRVFLRSGIAATAAAGIATIAPNWMLAEAEQPAATDLVGQMRAQAAKTPIQTTKLRDNLYLLQGVGGNMVAQTGPEGKLLIDASFSTAVPRIVETLAGLSKDAPDTLINTHWHFDHTDGNGGLHQAGFSILAHNKTRERLSTPQTIKAYAATFPPYPAGALPATTFDTSMHIWHNGDSLDLVHFDPAHTDTDIYIHFHNADVLHVADIFFNGLYPFIDEGTGGSIGGMVRASEKALSLAGDSTKIVPGHGPLATKADLKKYHDMLADVRDRVSALKNQHLTEAEVIAKKPTDDYDAAWGKGLLSPAQFVGIVYRTV